MAEQKRGILQRLATTWLKMTGWSLGNGPPEGIPKLVLICQHSSNWDGYNLLLYAMAFRMRVNWVGKDSLFKGPFGGIARALGGIPVDRSASHNLVSQLVEAVRTRDRIFLGMAPEGTRSRVEYWKSGFYNVAREAGVPIVLAHLDYAKKVAGFGEVIYPSGDLKADMDRIRAFYAGATPKHPEKCGPIRLKDETAGSAAAE